MHDLRRLRAFYAVAETGSFSAAGLKLGYAQSVVSHHVAALEREFGLTLFNRATRPVSVTDAGARLLRHATEVLGHVTAAEDELRAVAGLERGTLHVGAFLSACNSFVPAALARFQPAHPEVEARVQVLEEQEALRGCGQAISISRSCGESGSRRSAAATDATRASTRSTSPTTPFGCAPAGAPTRPSRESAAHRPRW